MISLRLFIATLALAVKLDNVRAAQTWTSPQSFYYKPDDPYDTMLVNIILKNVPAEANNYFLYRQTDNCDRSPAAQNSAECDVPVKNETIPTNRTITIMQKLNKGSLRIYIVLRNGNKICATKWIMDGLRDTSANENAFSKNCLNKYKNWCEIIADFGKQCEDSHPKMFCSQKERLICEVLEDLPEDTGYQWYQWNRDGLLIGTIPPVTGSKTEFKMTIHKFDINTYITSVLYSIHWENNLTTEEFKIPSPTNRYKNYVVEHRKKYIANQVVELSCSNNAYTHIGWIEPTGDIIKTYNETTVSGRLTKDHDGSLLCCLNYHTEIIGTKTTVERTITNITELVYVESVNPDNEASPTDHPPEKKSVSLQKPTKTGTASRPHTHNTSAATSDTQHQKGPTTPNGSADPSSDAANYYIAIAAVAGIILLTSLIYVVIKKCCRKSSDPEQTLELETYATTNTVLYAELDIRPGTGPGPANTEDATYAEIIGVLRPENGHVKK